MFYNQKNAMKKVNKIQNRSLHLTHMFPMHPFPTPENIRKTNGFLIFSVDRERVHWEQMG